MDFILFVVIASFTVGIEDYGGNVQEWNILYVDEISNIICSNADERTIGCTNHFWKIIQVKAGQSHYQSLFGVDVFGHEVLHARCDMAHPEKNWHIFNKHPLIFQHANYWETCGIDEYKTLYREIYGIEYDENGLPLVTR